VGGGDLEISRIGRGRVGLFDEPEMRKIGIVHTGKRQRLPTYWLDFLS
jgi:hypothetical protein